jgi:CubicO group peptidase (beta-lactamase class C family)
MKKNLLLSILFSLIIFGCVDNSKKINKLELTEGSALKEGVSQERLLRIDDYLEKSIEDSIIPGAVALVTRNGKIIYHKAFGYENFSEKIPFEKNDIFRIASMTKAITSLAVVMLWEEGKFSLDDPIKVK